MELGKLTKFNFEDLKFEQQNYLVGELLKCASLKNSSSRTRIIEALMSPIPNGVEREGKPREVVFSILKECDKHDEGFRYFLMALKEEEQREEIYDEFTILSQKLLVIKQIYALFKNSSKSSILSNPAQIKELYKNSLPVNELNLPMNELNELKEGTITMAIDCLSGFSRVTNPEATFPLLKFIKSFKLNEEESNNLNISLINLVQKLLCLYRSDFSTDDINHIENFNLLQNSREDRNDQSDSLDLLIQIKVEESRNRSRSSGANKYSISFYHWRSGSPSAVKFAELSKVLDRNIQTKITSILEGYFKNSEALQPKIHFFLPTTLMYLDVDQWQYDSGEKSVPVLSENNHVLLRASPNNPGKHQRQVKARWNSNKIKYLQIETKNGLSPKLKLEKDTNLIFFSFPLNHTDTDIFDIISSPEIGIPIAIWMRESVDFCHQELDLGQANDKDDILNKVRDLRLKAREEEAKNKERKHFGSHISLLFEDPNRSIPIISAVTPQQSGAQLKA